MNSVGGPSPAPRETYPFDGRQTGGGLAVAGLILGGLALAGLAAALLALGLFSTTGSVVTRGGNDELKGRLASDLKNAATAEESYRTRHPRYTSFIGELEQEGLRANFATLIVVKATKNAYCIEAASGGIVMHYSSTVGMPEDGGC